MTETIAVRSPYDGSEIGVVPANSAEDVDEAVRVANGALAAGPLAPWRRAEIPAAGGHGNARSVAAVQSVARRLGASSVTGSPVFARGRATLSTEIPKLSASARNEDGRHSLVATSGGHSVGP